MATQILLREALKQAIQSNLTLPDNTVVESRYMPRIDADQLENLHVSVFLLNVQTETIGREVDSDEYSLAIGIQQKVPVNRSGDTVMDGDDNITFIDQKIEFVESVKSLFRSGGVLRHQALAGCRFDKMQHDPQFEPYHLAQYGIFTSVIELTYKSEED